MGDAAAFGHGLERAIAESLDAELVAEFPDPNEHIVGRDAV